MEDSSFSHKSVSDGRVLSSPNSEILAHSQERIPLHKITLTDLTGISRRAHNFLVNFIQFLIGLLCKEIDYHQAKYFHVHLMNMIYASFIFDILELASGNDAAEGKNKQ